MTEPRPDPITAKVTVGAIGGAAAGGGLGALIPLLTDLPAGTAWVEWLRWGLTLAGALLAVWVQAQRAKQETTPLSDPAIEVDGQLVKLEPAGPVDVGFFDDTDDPPLPGPDW
jgi:hypothetical protein